jgi:hypothetical protein
VPLPGQVEDILKSKLRESMVHPDKFYRQFSVFGVGVFKTFQHADIAIVKCMDSPRTSPQFIETLTIGITEVVCSALYVSIDECFIT